MAVEPQVVRIVLEDPAGGRQPPPGRAMPFSGPIGSPAPGQQPAPVNRLPTPVPGGRHNPDLDAAFGVPTPPQPTQAPPAAPVPAELVARANAVAESNKALAAAMADPAYVKGQQVVLDVERERLRLLKESTAIVERAAATPTDAALVRELAERAGRIVEEQRALADTLDATIGDPAYLAALTRVAEAQERATAAAKEQAQVAAPPPAPTRTAPEPGAQPPPPTPPGKLTAPNPAPADGGERARLAEQAAGVADARGAAGKAAAEKAAQFGLGRAGQVAAGAAAGGSAGALAVAGGPIGLAMAAADAAAAGWNKLGKTAQVVGQGMQSLAANDTFGMVTKAVDGAADALGEIPIVGKAYAAQLHAMTAAAKAYQQTVDAFVQRGKELQGYNADLAAANAAANVKRMEADMKEAEAVGKSTGRLTENQADIESNIRELLLPFKEVLTDLLAAVSGVGKEVTEFLKPAAHVIRFMLKVQTALPTEVLELFGTVLDKLDKWSQLNPTGFFDDRPKPPTEPQMNAMMRGLFASLDQRPGPGGGVAGPPRAMPGPGFGRNG